MSELDFIRWVRRSTPASDRVLVGPGDDAAEISWPGGSSCLATTDMLLEGSCFVLSEAGPRLVGRKALAVNLSDIAAMAGRPVVALVSVALPRSFSLSQAEELHRGLCELADEYSVAVAGGDTNSWNGPLAINVALLGEPTGDGPVRRQGAEPGDWLLVTGPLGGSIRGKHLRFTPRVREAQTLHRAARLKAMIDISDGLAADLNHILEESRCGAVLREVEIPVSDDARRMNDSRSALDHALGDGEDFELLFAVSATDGRRLLAEQPLRDMDVTLYRVGECVAEGLWLEKSTGERTPLPPLGYVHEFGG